MIIADCQAGATGFLYFFYGFESWLLLRLRALLQVPPFALEVLSNSHPENDDKKMKLRPCLYTLEAPPPKDDAYSDGHSQAPNR